MRPYTFEEWEKVIVFKELFDKSNSSQLQNLVSNFYSLLEDWNNSKSDNENSIKLLASALIKNVLKPKKIDLNLQNKIACLFGADKMQGIPEKITIQHIEKFIDYYYFWHKALKEV
jgi:hypothetical protein